MPRRRKPVLAASAATVAAAAVVALALVAREGAPSRPADPARAAPATPKAAFPPPLPAAAEPAAAAVADPAPAAGEEEGPALCAGCLSERAVLDVVETYLRHLDPVLLHGGLWAHPLADVAPETPGPVYGLPKLPPGLLEAPEFNPMGMTVDTREYAVETTWLVWVRLGGDRSGLLRIKYGLGRCPRWRCRGPPSRRRSSWRWTGVPASCIRTGYSTGQPQA